MNAHHAVFDAEAQLFLRALLHAARNTMQGTQSALSLLRLQAAGRPALLELVDEAERGGDALGALFEAARAHVTPVEVHRCSEDVMTLGREAWALAVAGVADARLRVEPASCAWSLDRALLTEALQAVFRNAAEARPTGLRVRASAESRDGDDGALLVLDVADNGPGLGDEARRRALEPFWSTRRGALGMGLPRAARAIAAHGGVLTVADSDDGGTRVLMRIPEARP